MWKDEIVEEVRDARRKIGAEHGHDLRRIVEDLRRRQVSSGHKVVTLEPRTPQPLRRVSGAMLPRPFPVPSPRAKRGKG